MKKILVLICLIVLSGCSEEENSIVYYNYIRFKNDSGHNIKIITDNTESGVTYLDIQLPTSNNSEYIKHTLYNNLFYGMHGYENRIKIIFTDNDKGYICGDYPDNSGLCFTTKGSPLRNENTNDFILDKQEGTSSYYTYVITQEDYENAHVLP